VSIELHLSHARESGTQVLEEEVVVGVGIDHGAGVQGPLDHLSCQNKLVRVYLIILKQLNAVRPAISSRRCVFWRAR